MKFRDPTLVAGSRETLVAAVGEPVRRDKIPNWLRLATIRRLAIPRDQHTGWRVLAWIRRQYPGWLDHEGTCVVDGQEVLVSEPYVMGADDLQAAIDFAKAVDADLEIDATSYHYPTKCLRITISQRRRTAAGGTTP